MALHQQGHLTQAKQGYKSILVHYPQELTVLHLLAILYQQQGEFQQALTSLNQVIALKPNAADVLLLAGIVSGQLERHTEALSYFNQAIALQPNDIASHYNRAIACHKLQLYQQALMSLEKIIQQQANHADALNLRGTILAAMKRYEEALCSYQQALAVKTDYPVACYHCAIVLEQLKRPQQAITLKPNYSKAISNLASLYMGIQQYSKAANMFSQLLAVKPDYPYAEGKLFYAQAYCCDWRNYQQSVDRLVDAVRQQQKVITPFDFLNVTSTVHDEKICAETYVQDRYPAALKSLWTGERYQHKKIKVAYISADFYNHATSILMIELFEQHDKSRFEFVAIAFNSKNDDMTKRVKAAFDTYIDVSEKTDLAIAKLIRSMEIDIAVDLKGHTTDARLGIFAHRPAPIQVNYLGQASTIGAPYIDYILVDQLLVPPASQQDYTQWK